MLLWWGMPATDPMTDLTQTTPEQVRAVHDAARRRYDDFVTRGVKLDLTRGKPASEQLDLSGALLTLPGAGDYLAADRSDTRNYGRAPGPPGTARADGAAIRAGAGAHAHRRQLQPGFDARHHRLRAAVRRLRQPASLVEERARGISLPGARLRPPLRDLPGLRHRDDPGADDRRRSRSRSGRAAGQGRRSDPGHVVHAEVQQPDRHGVLERDRGTACGHAHGGAGLPAVLGQRLRRAPSHARADRDRQHRRRLRAARAPEPSVRLRLDVQDHARGRRRGAVRIVGRRTSRGT